jgi:ABC-type Mn2+/Zn2+ transport system permease subunit
VFFIILALDPMKYPVLVPFSGLAAVFIGVVCGVTGLAVGMPALWFLGDSLSCALLGVLIVVFWRQANKEGIK